MSIFQGPSFEVLNTSINAVQIPDTINQMEDWIGNRSGTHLIAVTGMHGIMEARKDPYFKQILNEADLVVPDGMPVVLVGRYREGYPHMKRRVAGPELMETFCQETGNRYRHFFYGGAEGVADKLAYTLEEKYGVRVAGTYCPPFRPLTPEEDAEVISIINQSNADILWVGLSTPKQEKWMYEHRDKLQVPVMLSVGAAFDFLAGLKPRAPSWMQESGFEWLYRLVNEPRRLWRRVLTKGVPFIGLILLEAAKYKYQRKRSDIN